MCGFRRYFSSQSRRYAYRDVWQNRRLGCTSSVFGCLCLAFCNRRILADVFPKVGRYDYFDSTQFFEYYCYDLLYLQDDNKQKLFIHLCALRFGIWHLCFLLLRVTGNGFPFFLCLELLTFSYISDLNNFIRRGKWSFICFCRCF